MDSRLGKGAQRRAQQKGEEMLGTLRFAQPTVPRYFAPVNDYQDCYEFDAQLAVSYTFQLHKIRPN